MKLRYNIIASSCPSVLLFSGFLLLNSCSRQQTEEPSEAQTTEQTTEQPAEEPVETIKLLTADNLNLNKHWVIKDGVLSTSETPGGILWSKAAYGDFKITLEYKTSEKCNSGLFFRTDPKNPVQGGFEIQIASDGLYNGKHIVGSLYDAKEPTKSMAKPDGEWNTMSLTCKGAQITVVLNGEQVNDLNIDNWDTAEKNPDGSKNKFKKALKDMSRTGHFGLQYHGQPIFYRNIVITPLG